MSEREPYQERVIEEQTELTTKIIKLVEFIFSGKASSLPAIQTDLLIRQLSAMRTYPDILRQRIGTFEE